MTADPIAATPDPSPSATAIAVPGQATSATLPRARRGKWALVAVGIVLLLAAIGIASWLLSDPVNGVQVMIDGVDVDWHEPGVGPVARVALASVGGLLIAVVVVAVVLPLVLLFGVALPLVLVTLVAVGVLALVVGLGAVALAPLWVVVALVWWLWRRGRVDSRIKP